jgi:hypothetical protein
MGQGRQGGEYQGGLISTAMQFSGAAADSPHQCPLCVTSAASAQSVLCPFFTRSQTSNKVIDTAAKGQGTKSLRDSLRRRAAYLNMS